jgi:hypothetical protein
MLQKRIVDHNMEHRVCKKCGIEKELSDKFFYKSNSCLSYTCKECAKLASRKNSKDNKETRKIWFANYRENNRQELIEYSKTYYQENKEEYKKQQKEYYVENQDEILEKKKIYYEDNKENILEYKSEYDKNNRSKINERRRNKIKNDVTFMLRCLIAPKVRQALKKSGGIKNGDSVWKFLPYLPQELKKHLQIQFEPWMTWDNYGSYNKKTWKDHDQLTWTWSIDHIIPCSNFIYTSMEDDSFKECWALSNLRPYSAKQNIVDGNRRII